MPTRADWEAAIPKCPRWQYKEGRRRERCAQPLLRAGESKWRCDIHGLIRPHEIVVPPAISSSA